LKAVLPSCDLTYFLSTICHNLKVLGGMRGMTALVWLGSAVDPDEVYM